MRRTHLGAVTKVRIPITPPLGSEIQDMPNGTQQINTALFDVARQRRMGCVEVAKGAVRILGENRNGRVLISLAVFAAEIVFERIGAATQQPQPVPAARAC